MKAAELREKTDSELKTELDALLKAHFSLRMQLGMQQLSKNSEIRRIKRDIARVKTVCVKRG